MHTQKAVFSGDIILSFVLHLSNIVHHNIVHLL